MIITEDTFHVGRVVDYEDFTAGESGYTYWNNCVITEVINKDKGIYEIENGETKERKIVEEWICEKGRISRLIPKDPKPLILMFYR